MAYATVADLVARYGEQEIIQLTDRAGTGVIDAAVANAALADATAEIDAYLSRRWQLPLASTPALIRQLCCEIARYRLWEDQASDEVRRRYEDAVRLLRDLAAGRADLGEAAAAAHGLSGAATPRASAPPRTFTPRLLGAFRRG